MADIDRRMIAPGFVEEALDSLRRMGRPTGPLLSSLGLPAVVDQPVSGETYGALWLAIARELDDEFFGMGGRPMRSGNFTFALPLRLACTNAWPYAAPGSAFPRRRAG